MPKIVDVQEKKQELYRSATQVFLDKGYNNTTLLDIAKLCKRAGFYFFNADY